MNGCSSIDLEPPIFDELGEKFLKNIYGSWKGALRLRLIWNDLMNILGAPLQAGQYGILDVGGGHAPISRRLAQCGNSIVVCDPSQKMLDQLRTELKKEGLTKQFTIFHQPIERLEAALPFTIQLVQLHAVLEWSKEPFALLKASIKHLAPLGWLSLLFFNRDALWFKHAQLGHFDYLEADMPARRRSSLQPICPLSPHVVYRWLAELDLKIGCITPIRAIVDYLAPNVRATLSSEDCIALELRHMKEPIAIHTARYLHVLAQFSP